MQEIVKKYNKYQINIFYISCSLANLEIKVWNDRILKDDIVTMVKLFQDLAGDIEGHKIALGDLLY